MENKTYVCFVNDHSKSMTLIANAAKDDFNANLVAVRDAATREKQDTVVSVIALGLEDPTGGKEGNHPSVHRQIMLSNPHILKPVESWPTPGGTPLYDALGDALNLHLALPDIHRESVSVLIMVTTDGEEVHSRIYGPDYYAERVNKLKALIGKATATGRFTIAVRVPFDAKAPHINALEDLGIPANNIKSWVTTNDGMAASTKVQKDSVDSYFKSRATGKRSSNSFYTDASNVNVAALDKIDPKEISLYVVDQAYHGMEIREFVLKKRQEYLYGSAYYQLAKTEAKVGPEKVILIRDRQTGFFFYGENARKMLGLPTEKNKNARINPGDHGNFDVFIQSTSINRKLQGGFGLAIWDKGPGVRKFTEADTAHLKARTDKVDNGLGQQVVQLPQIKKTNKPTPSNIPVTPLWHKFATRVEARNFCLRENRKQTCIVDMGKSHIPKSERWQVPVKKG